MHQIRQHIAPDQKIVVRGGTRLAEVWPAEHDAAPVALPVPASAPVAEVSGIDAVVALLASVDETDLAAYRAWHGQVARLAS